MVPGNRKQSIERAAPLGYQPAALVVASDSSHTENPEYVCPKTIRFAGTVDTGRD